MSINSQYVDAQDAIKRVGGNKDLYLKLLGSFIDGGHVGLLINSLQSGDMEAAARDAHALKGISANLSLHKLNICAVELEQKIKANEDYTESFENLKEVNKITLEHIEAFRNEN